MNRLAAGECRVWARSVRGSLQLERTRSVFFLGKIYGVSGLLYEGFDFYSVD